MAKRIIRISGSEFGDTLTAAGNANSTLYGLGGSDLIKQSSESIKFTNSMHGGPGNDEVSYGANTRVADGEDGDDRVVGDLGSNQRVLGGSGNDFIHSRVHYAGKILKNITIDAGEGDDEIDYWNNFETITKNTKVLGGGGNDTMYLRPLRGNDRTSFDLGAGDDSLVVAAIPYSKDVVINGGDGFDILDMTGGWDNQNYLGLSRDANGTVSAKWANYADKNGVRYVQSLHLPGFEAFRTEDLGLIEFSTFTDLPLT